MREVTLIVAFEGEKDAPQRFSLYPPDRAARMAVRVPPARDECAYASKAARRCPRWSRCALRSSLAEGHLRRRCRDRA
jgi:hypothetical protein